MLAFAADAGAFAALGGQDAGVAGVSVAPGQVLLNAPGEHGVVRVIRAADDESAQWPELGFGLAQDARAVRLYEAAGLMPEPARSPTGYRLYGPADLATLLRIRRLRTLGFEVEQIRVILSPEEPADLGAALAVLRDDLLRRVEALRATIKALDSLRAEVMTGGREAWDALAPVLQAALGPGEDLEYTPLVVRLRERIAALEGEPRWAALQQRLGQLRDVQGPPAGDVDQLARELASVLPRKLVPDDLADAVWPTTLLRVLAGLAPTALRPGPTLTLRGGAGGLSLADGGAQTTGEGDSDEGEPEIPAAPGLETVARGVAAGGERWSVNAGGTRAQCRQSTDHHRRMREGH